MALHVPLLNMHCHLPLLLLFQFSPLLTLLPLPSSLTPPPRSPQPVFIPLYKLFLVYGKIFRLSFGPKNFVVISDPVYARQVSKASTDLSCACGLQYILRQQSGCGGVCVWGGSAA